MCDLKRQIRQIMKGKRKQLGKQVRAEKSQRIYENVTSLTVWEQAKRAMVYIDFRDEVETEPLIRFLWENDVEVVVPVCDLQKKDMQAVVLNSYDELQISAYGIREPLPSAATTIVADPRTIDIMIVPGLAFDREGGRLGYGAGYYDKYFPQTNLQMLKIALAYDEQLISNIPIEEHDVKVDIIVTDAEVIYVRE